MTQDVSRPLVPENPVKFLRLAAVRERTGLPVSQIYRLQAAGKFPRGVKLAASTVAWVESEIQQWCLDRINASRGAV